jgi:hypothetical protein
MLVAWLINDNLLLRDSGSYQTVKMYVCVCIVITVAVVVMPLRDLGIYGLIFVTLWSFIHALVCTCTSVQRSAVVTASE